MNVERRACRRRYIGKNCSTQYLHSALSDNGIHWTHLIVGDSVVTAPGDTMLANVLRDFGATDSGLLDDFQSTRDADVSISQFSISSQRLTVDASFSFKRPRVAGSSPLPENWTISVCLRGGQHSNDAPVQSMANKATGYTTEALPVPSIRLGKGQEDYTASSSIWVQGRAVSPSGREHLFGRSVSLKPWKMKREFHVWFEDYGEDADDIAWRVLRGEHDLTFFVDDHPELDDSFGWFQMRSMFCVDHRSGMVWGMTWELED